MIMLRKLEVAYVPLRSIILSTTGNFDILMQQTGEIWRIQSLCSPPQPAWGHRDMHSLWQKSVCQELENTLLPLTSWVHKLLNLGGRKRWQVEWPSVKDERYLLSKLLVGGGGIKILS